ncbi:MAG: efflux RND transporter permease subunit [Oligoflexia bacterium]|nr:efflux RND transporter permease subunit [Oligoflexia bacterium]
MLTVIVLLLGIYSLFAIRKDLFPKVEFDITLVAAVLPGASPEQAEKLLVNPLEQAIREVDGIKKVTSNATEGRAVLTLQLDPDARDPDKTNTDIQRAIDRVDGYPEEAERPIVTALESGQTPVIELTVSSNELDDLVVRDAAKFLADELAFVPGVAKITKSAWRKRELQVLLNEDKLQRAEVSVGQVISALKNQNIQLPGGDMILPNGREKSIKTDGEIRTTEDAEKTVIRSNFSGYAITVKDLGRVKEWMEKPTILYRSNGEKSFSLTIIKKEKADALQVVTRVQKRMDEIKDRLPKGIQYEFVNDFTEYLSNRIQILSSNMIVGIALVFIVLALFLPFRVACVVAIGIPFCMLLAITTIHWMGMSINLISLIGLIIVSGMLVDDAIVVVENVYRRMELGDTLEVAIVEGTAEMVGPVTASVLTTVAAFSPMMFMTGVFGKFVFEIPVMVILPLVYSLFEAFLVAPCHIFTIVGDSVMKARKSEKIHWYDKFLPKYRNLIKWTIFNKWKTISIFLALLIFTGVVATRMSFILFPPDGIYSFFIRVDGAPGASLEEMEDMVKEIEPFIAKLPKEELRAYVANIGLQQNDPNDPLTKRASHYAQIRVNLTPESERDRAVGTIVEELRAAVPKPKGAEKIGFEIAKGGPPQGRPISINIYGEEFSTLKKIADRIKEEMKTVDGVLDIEDSEIIGKKEIKVTPDSKKVASVGLSVADVAQSVRASFAGVVATSSRSLDEEIDIRVQLDEEKKDGNVQLSDIKIGNQRGHLIPLNQIARFEETDSRLLIQHQKYKRLLNVSAQVDLSKTTAIQATRILEEKLNWISREYNGYSIEFGGENEDTQESMASLGKAFVVAAILIFTILVITFNSFSQPILVLFSIPLGFIGVIWALLLHGRPLSFMAMLGIIALAGVIVNNAIVFMDFFNQRKKEKGSLVDALLDTATARLRPIILTSCTTVLGLFPTAYGIGGSDGFVMALALSLGWGLAIGSICTAVFFPALLMTFETTTEKFLKFINKTPLRSLFFVLKGR